MLVLGNNLNDCLTFSFFIKIYARFRCICIWDVYEILDVFVYVYLYMRCIRCIWEQQDWEKKIILKTKFARKSIL